MTKKNKNIIFEYCFSGVLAGMTAGIIVAPHSGALRSASEFSAHIMLGILAVSILAMLLEKKKIMFAGLACAAALALWLKNASNDHLKLPIINEELQLRVAHINLSNVDDSIDDVLNILEVEQVDVVSFQELTPDWTNTLAVELGTKFPYAYTNVRIDPFGKAIYSRYPYSSADTLLSGGIPSLSVNVDVGDEVFHIISTYLTPALDNSSLEKAAAQLKRVSDEVNQVQDHVIALGEYNMVYWTQEIRNFRSSTNLKNSRRDIAQGNLRVPYDHIFFSDDLECTEFKEMIGTTQNYLGIIGAYQIKSKLAVDGELSLR